MTFDVEIYGRTRRVSISPAHAGSFRVVLDGDVRRVDVARLEAQGLALVLLDDRHRVHEAAVVGTDTPGELRVTLRGVAVTARVNRGRTAPAAPAATGEQRIVAPMPGRVVRVLVAEGDHVLARQGLVVVEAMKMENELKAAWEGRVQQVAVTEGVSVEAGRLLVVIA